VEEARQAVLSAGDVFHGKYEVRRCLKVGGMAVVYEVVHRVTRRPSALKILFPEVLSERGMRDRFAIEARIPAEIEGDHIARVLDAGIDDATGSAFLVMELLRGEDLETLLRRRAPLAAFEVVALLRQAAIGLDAVHAARIVHRDLKPENLFLCEVEGRPPVLKVLDFGIAKIVTGAALTTRNLGTPVYMSPEQVRGDGDVDAAADVYALGQIAFTLLVGAPYWAEESAAGGRVLFDGIEGGTSEAASARAAARGVRLPETFDAWFATATASEPEDRFETAGALVEALAAALGAPHTAMTSPPRLDPRARRWSARSVVVSLVAIGLLGGAWGALRARARARDDAPRQGASAATPAPPAPAPIQTGSQERPEAPGSGSAPPPLPERSAPGQPAARPSSSGLPRAPLPRSASAAVTAAPPPIATAPASPFGPGAF
jgi:serine/threonine protein kinase